MEVTFRSPRQEVNTGFAQLNGVAGLEKQPMCVSTTLQPYYKQAAFHYARAEAEAKDDQTKGGRTSAFTRLPRLHRTTNREIRSTPLPRTLLEDLQSIYM